MTLFQPAFSVAQAAGVPSEFEAGPAADAVGDAQTAFQSW